jgi:hypothetical protein
MWWWSGWPTPSVFFAPVMMLTFMALGIGCMFVMMRGMHGRHRPHAAVAGSSGADLALRGPHMPARFPEGASAFEEYRAETLRRLDQEQKDFQEFLGHLRMAKDKAEFDQFMAERRARPSS